jgi:phosphoadenosine phosphosulfate reductase
VGLFEVTPEEIYQAAIEESLDRKIEKAIALIREYEPMALELSPDGYYVAFSGGKDSIVMERLFKMARVKYKAWYNNVTIDPPELVQFIKQQYPEVRWNNNGKNLPMAMADKTAGPPTRIVRWCCEVYKEQGGNGCFKAIGVRAEESARRKGLWESVRRDTRGGQTIYTCPILYWTEKDIWAFIGKEEMPYCQLYDEGFKRLGCVGCPMGGPKGMARDFSRWPKYEKMWKRGFRAWWDKYRGVPRRDGKPRSIEKFDSVDDLWNWWVSGKAYEGEQADCQMWLW